MADITKDMIERGARALAGTDDVQQWRWAAEEVLSAALEGMFVAKLPEPNRREDECGVMAAFWYMRYPGPSSQLTDVMSYEIDRVPVVYIGPGPDYMYSVAAMREAARAIAEKLGVE